MSNALCPKCGKKMYMFQYDPRGTKELAEDNFTPLLFRDDLWRFQLFVCFDCNNYYVYNSSHELTEIDWREHFRRYSEKKEYLRGSAVYKCSKCRFTCLTIKLTEDQMTCPLCGGELIER